jgi:hypothetical protein
MSHDCAVYAEYSDSDKPMRPGANPRVFNRVEVESAGSTRLDPCTGVVTLRPGTYHVTACSIVTPYDPAADTDGRVSPQPRPYGGYCRLRHRDRPERDDPPIALGTISNANMLPSLIDTYLRTEREVEVVLDHQAGEHVDGLYLQVAVGGSSWHVFARISIHRL